LPIPVKAAQDAGFNESQVTVREQNGYDHSYYFVRDRYFIPKAASFDERLLCRYLPSGQNTLNVSPCSAIYRVVPPMILYLTDHSKFLKA
jgi:hypothetical protein